MNSRALASGVGSIDRFGADGSVPTRRGCGLPRHRTLIHRHLPRERPHPGHGPSDEAAAGEIRTVGGATTGVEPRLAAMEDVGGVTPSGADHRVPSDRVSRNFGGTKGP